MPGNVLSHLMRIEKLEDSMITGTIHHGEIMRKNV